MNNAPARDFKNEGVNAVEPDAFPNAGHFRFCALITQIVSTNSLAHHSI